MSRENPARCQRGYSLLEVLIATVLVVTALVPAMEALNTASTGRLVLGTELQRVHRLSSRMEEVLAVPMSSLVAAAAAGTRTTPSTYSDPVGTTDRRLVFLSLYDGDNADNDNDPFTGTDAGLIWLRVEVAGTPLWVEALKGG